MGTRQTAVLKSIDRHLDSLQATIGWASPTVVLFAVTGILDKYPLEIFGIEIQKSEAFYFAAPFYFFVNLKCLDLLVRLDRLVRLLDSNVLEHGLNSMAFHPFIANPFGSFGASTGGKLTGAKGLALLIVLWWTAHASLLIFVKDFDFGNVSVLLVFVAVGSGSLFAIKKFYDHVIPQLVGNPLHSEWQNLRKTRWSLVWIAWAVGLAALAAALDWRQVS